MNVFENLGFEYKQVWINESDALTVNAPILLYVVNPLTRDFLVLN